MEEYTCDEIAVFLDHFTPIWENGGKNHIPYGVLLTVYCDVGDEENTGFVENVMREELGLVELIAASWIEQEKLNVLMASRQHPTPS